jgi:hypothetical protein
MEDFAPLVIGSIVFSIPLVAIVGGIVAGIVRTVGRNRLIELAQRERIAAIERGIDPAKLPPLPSFEEERSRRSPEEDSLRRSNGFLIAGLISLAFGFSLAMVIRFADPGEPGWAGGLVVAAVGLALVLSAMIIRPRVVRPYPTRDTGRDDAVSGR